MPRRNVSRAIASVMASEAAMQSGPKHDPRSQFIEALKGVYAGAEDPASEQTLSQLCRLIPQHWHAFEESQSDLSTWQMVLKATETLLRVRLMKQKGAADQAAHEEFHTWLEGMGFEARREVPAEPLEDDEEEG